jgi:hypothetical protein
VAFVCAHATGALLLHQWRFEGLDIRPDQLDPMLDAELDRAGRYSLIVSNHLGTSSSPDLNLHVLPIMITESPQDQIARLAASDFTVVAGQ